MVKPLFDFTDKPQQKAFFFDRENPSIGGGGGYNSGKSYAMVGKIHTMLEMFHGSHAIIGRKTYGALEKSVIPTYEKIAKVRNGGKWNGPIIEKFTDMTAHYRNGSKLWFVTYDDVEKFRGPNIAFAGISQAEEVAHEIFLELKGRCRQWNEDSIEAWQAKYGEEMRKMLGYVPRPFNQLICEFNPAPNWVKQEFFFNKTGSNKFYDIPTAENEKFHAKGWIEALKASYTKETYDRFINGSWDVFGGMVYPEFDIEALHGVPNFKMPDHWPRLIGWDHGYRNPTAIHAAGVDEMGNIVIYKEHYQDNLTVRENAECFKAMARGDRFPVGNDEKFLVFMDYSVKGVYDKDGKTIWDQYNEEGIFGLNPDKDVSAGINMVKEYMKPDPEREFPQWHPRKGEKGSPKLFIVRSECPNLINELQMYQWEETKEENSHKEQPKKYLDHACDDTRYIIMAVGKQMAPWILAPPTPKQIGAIAAQVIAASAFKHATPIYDEEGEEWS